METNEQKNRYDRAANPSAARLTADRISLTEAENSYEREREKPERDDSFYENSYGMGSDSSRSLLVRGNAMTFENDHEGQKLDDEYDEARRNG